MKTLIEKSKYFHVIAVITLLVTFGLALLWGVARAIGVWYKIIASYGQSSEINLLLIKLIDIFLIAIVLYLLAASIYYLFVGNLEKPSRMVARNISELKSKLSTLIVLVISVRFVELLFEENIQAIEILWFGIASAFVMGVLIVFAYLSTKSVKEGE